MRATLARARAFFRSRAEPRAAALLGLSGLLLLCSACHKTTCDELVPEPIAGVYRGGGQLAKDRVLGVGLEATSEQVILSFRAKDGSRIRAFYRVTKKTKLH